MFGALKKLLGIRKAIGHDRKHTEIFLFSESGEHHSSTFSLATFAYQSIAAYFSNRVPRAFKEKWAHGGEVSSGTTLDVRARYFFAMDPSEPWVTKLFAKSVMVIHAGWIVHCADQAFRVPITEYILDDRFVPAPPYKLTDNPPQIYVPLSDVTGLIETESSESGHAAIQPSDTPSTPASMPRKRKREQVYFDSPSGSLIFSGFDKDGMPRRPRKLRKLRFDPSFSPGEGRGWKSKEETRFDGFGDHLDTLDDVSGTSVNVGRGGTAGALLSPSDGVGVRSPETTDKLLTCVESSEPYRCRSVDEDLSKPTHTSSPAASVDVQNRMPPVRAIDFTNLPPRARRGRFSAADGTTSAEMRALLAIMRPSEHKTRTPKKISFANHARVRVYTVSPQRSDTKDGASAGPSRGCSGDEFEDGPEVNEKISSSVVKVEGDDSIMEAITNLAPQIDFLRSDDDTFPGIDQLQNDTLTLTMDEVQKIRHHLLESSANNGVDDGRLVTLFKLGKTFRGMTFRHVWMMYSRLVECEWVLSIMIQD
ncbi:hypothetical protein JVU11DRAFT_6685 [Chiua virens]|nr:hypothetical protein JVU11DRAFT_6685 [Chiua virens]